MFEYTERSVSQPWRRGDDILCPAQSHSSEARVALQHCSIVIYFIGTIVNHKLATNCYCQRITGFKISESACYSKTRSLTSNEYSVHRCYPVAIMITKSFRVSKIPGSLRQHLALSNCLHAFASGATRPNPGRHLPLKQITGEKTNGYVSLTVSNKKLASRVLVDDVIFATQTLDITYIPWHAYNNLNYREPPHVLPAETLTIPCPNTMPLFCHIAIWPSFPGRAKHCKP